MPVKKFHRAKLTFVLSAARSPDQKSHEVLVLFIRVAATSTTSCRSKFRTWPFLERRLVRCCIVTAAHASTRKQQALQCSSSSTLPTGHFVRPRYRVVVTWHFRSDLSVDRPLYWFLVLVFHRSRVIVQHISQVNMPFGTHKKILQIPIVFMAIVHIQPMIATS